MQDNFNYSCSQTENETISSQGCGKKKKANVQLGCKNRAYMFCISIHEGPNGTRHFQETVLDIGETPEEEDKNKQRSRKGERERGMKEGNQIVQPNQH